MRKLMRLAMTLSLVPLFVVSAQLPGHAERSQCGMSAGAELCLVVPDGTLSGESVIAATWAGRGSATVEFTLDGEYLNFEYLSPYSFVWPTDKELDGGYSLAARVHKGGEYGDYVSLDVELVNGNATSIPRNPPDYRTLFTPRRNAASIAAVGNGGAGKAAELRLLNYIFGTRPAAFLYLGEVHEFGSWATRRDHYGLASFDAPSGRGTWWGRLARYTLATAGNHERDYITEFRDYWHQRPMWSTVVVNGIRIYDLTSECLVAGGCGPTNRQAQWLAGQLAKNTERCVLVFWHRPVVSMDKKRSGDRMLPAWQLLARNGGDLVLNADTRDMEELRPMNARLQTGKRNSHMVELVSGAAGARWVRDGSSDPRVAWSRYEVPGAVFIQRVHGELVWRFRNSGGTLLRRGSVSC
jgi:hypothetical protein